MKSFKYIATLTPIQVAHRSWRPNAIDGATIVLIDGKLSSRKLALLCKTRIIIRSTYIVISTN